MINNLYTSHTRKNAKLYIIVICLRIKNQFVTVKYSGIQLAFLIFCLVHPVALTPIARINIHN